MVSPSPLLTTTTTNNDASVTGTSGNRSIIVTCTCYCHFCHHLSHHRHPPRMLPTSFANEEDHKEYSLLRLEVDNASICTDEMTCRHSQNIVPLRHKPTNCSRGPSSLSCLETGSKKCSEMSIKSGNNARVPAVITTRKTRGINCEVCAATDWESLTGGQLERTCLSSSSSGMCASCVSGSDNCGVTDSSIEMGCSNKYLVGCENDDGEDKNLWKTRESYHHCSSCCRGTYFHTSTRHFTNGHADKSSSDQFVNSKSESTMKVERERRKGGGGCRPTTLFGVDRRAWLLCVSLLFLSLVGSTCSISVFDDEDDDDFSGGISLYPRHRRSAEQFSSLHDALSLIPSNYSIHEPPPTNNSEATQVDFSVLIMNVRDIKELNEGYGDLELSLEMNLRIYWKDTRLSHLADRSGNKFIVLNPVLLDKLWHPDIFIDHVKGVQQPALISKPASLRVYPDSSVRYSARITVTMACQMDFHYYPADTQRCNVDMKSYAYSSRILALDWREGKGAVLVEYLELPNFDVALDTTQNFMVNTSSGSYSGIRFTILLRRKLSYHLIQTYLPSTLFIIVSWLSFLVPPESVPGRMALCMTTLLTLTAMFSAVRQNTPNVSYVKALDIWMVVCIIFVFLTLVEYTVLLKLKSKKTKPKPPASAHPERAIASAQQTQPQQVPPATRWTIPSLQYTSDNNAKFRGCKNGDGVMSENSNGGANGEMRHRENGDSTGAGDSANMNHPPAPPPSAHPPPPPPPPPGPLGPGDRPLNKYELAAKKIEKFTSAVIPTLFVIFQFIYWPWLINSSDYYHSDKSTTIFKSM